MPTLVNKYDLNELSHNKSKTELLIDTNQTTEIHILEAKDRSVISFPFGNKFDIIDGIIIIHDKPI